MKKICHITTVHSPFDTRIFHKEAKTLVNAGYNLVLIAQHNKEEVVDGIKIIPLPKPQSRIKRFFKLDYLVYKKAVEQRADIYHFHDPEFLPWAVKLKIKTKAKVIYDVHENIIEQILTKKWLPRFIRRLTSKGYGLIEKKILMKIDWILLAEDSYEKIYAKYKNKTVIRNYPLINKELMENKRALIDGFRNLVYVGGVTKERGIFEMIKAMQILKERSENVKIKIAGPVENELASKVNKFIYSLKLQDNIVFLGIISHPEALRLISSSRLGLAVLHSTPNYIESLPTKLFEYMVAGLPVVVSNFPLWKEIVKSNKCGICVNPLEPKEIARAVEYLITHPDEAKKMGENGKKAVLEKYNWKNEANKLAILYKEILK